MTATLVTGVAHPWRDLALYTPALGVLVDAYAVQAQVWNTTVSPAVQILPVAGGWLTLTVTGKQSTGSYAVIDPATSLPWAPASQVRRGRVIWQYQTAAGGEWTQIDMDLEALDLADAGRSGRELALVADVFAAAGLSWTAASVPTVRAELRRLRDLCERYCRVRFRPAYETVRLTGRGKPVLFLAEPLFALESLVDSETGEVLDVAYLRVWGSGTEDRQDPRIDVASEDLSIFTPSYWSRFGSSLVYSTTGLWGYVEADTQGPPTPVVAAVVAEAVTRLFPSSAGAGGGSGGSTVKREVTDGHSIEYAVPGAAAVAGAGLGAMSARLRDTLNLYRAPIAMGWTAVT